MQGMVLLRMSFPTTKPSSLTVVPPEHAFRNLSIIKLLRNSMHLSDTPLEHLPSTDGGVTTLIFLHLSSGSAEMWNIVYAEGIPRSIGVRNQAPSR
jgi:hypothetical protein